MQTPLVILQELNEVIKKIDKAQYDNLVALFNQNKRFFFFGEGRSGFIAKTAAMRLMHCGKHVYVVGETTTPAIEKEDVLVVVSGSGSSVQLEGLYRAACETGTKVALITANASKLKQENCAYGLAIPAATKKRNDWKPNTIQPLGNQFDQAAHLVIDAAIIDGPYSGNSVEALTGRHTNLE